MGIIILWNQLAKSIPFRYVTINFKNILKKWIGEFMKTLYHTSP